MGGRATNIYGTGGFPVPCQLCAEHVQQLGGVSPLPDLMEVKG